MPIALRGPRKAMRGKCERGRGSANADGGSVNAGAEVQTRTGRVRKSSRAMGTRRRRLSAPWPRFHGADRPDVYIIIHVRACCCGECALNPPTLPPIPRRSPSLAHAQRHALPEHFRSPTQRRCTPTQSRRTPAGCAMHARRPHNPLPAEDLPSPPQPRRTPAGCAMHSQPPSPPIPRRRSSLTPPHSDTPFPSTSAPPRSPDARRQAARCISRRPHNPFPPKTSARPRTATRPSRALPLPHAAPTHARRPHDPFPADRTTHSPQRHAASPSVPLRAQKNGTAQCMCDAECLGRPSLRSVIWVGEPRAVRHRCGALACRRGA